MNVWVVGLGAGGLDSRHSMHLNEEQGRCKGEGPPQGGLNAMLRASCGVCWCVEQWVIKEGWGGVALICGTLGSLCCSGGTLCLRRRVRRCHVGCVSLTGLGCGLACCRAGRWDEVLASWCRSCCQEGTIIRAPARASGKQGSGRGRVLLGSCWGMREEQPR